jgi:cyanophycinase
MRVKRGHLVIVGGAEDREDGREILSRIVALSGGAKARVVALTTASRRASEDRAAAHAIEESYRKAFLASGASHFQALHLFDRHAANDEANAEIIMGATCVFMTGGEQARLVSILGGTTVFRAMHKVYLEKGACISGTSAGASALTEHMMVGGPSDPLPRKGILPLAPGLGFLHHVIVDQHFSARQRLGRLLAVLAQNPFLIGMGIDEDTALVISPDQTMEVVGRGAVTMVDGRDMDNRPYVTANHGETMPLLDLRLHLLPSGFCFDLNKVRGGREHCEPRLSVSFYDALEAVIGNC